MYCYWSDHDNWLDDEDEDAKDVLFSSTCDTINAADLPAAASSSESFWCIAGIKFVQKKLYV